MKDISDIKIIGIDDKRPPRIRKEPYIDLFLKLSHQAPQAWCEDFNKLAIKIKPFVRIDKTEGIFIETFVRDMKHIPEHFDLIKKKVAACSEQYIENIRLKELAAANKNDSIRGQEGEQGKLNTIIAALKFDD